LINLIKDKLGINTEEIQLDFNFHPLNKVGLFYGTLDLMNRARTNQSKKLEKNAA